MLRQPALAAPDRALATELTYGVLRRRRQLDGALSRCAGKRLKDLHPGLHDVLRLGAYQIMHLDRVPAYAAVGCAVEQAKRRLGSKGAAQTNAILRKLSVADETIRFPRAPDARRDPVAHIAHLGALPPNIAQVLLEDLGFESACAFAKASVLQAPATLRANFLNTDQTTLAQEVGGTAGHHPRSVRLPSLGNLAGELPAVQHGRATPQDVASMRVVDLLDPRPNERVLDLCAAPGGKTTYIAERMENRGDVVAYDRLPRRLLEVEKSKTRLRLDCIRTTEALPPADPPFDRVLVDAPCSGLGTLRRHPEIRWRFRPEQMGTLYRTQREVLETGARFVRAGGTLVYSVCTPARKEGYDQVTAFRPEEFELVEHWSTSPADPESPDGFFAAKLVRRHR